MTIYVAAPSFGHMVDWNSTGGAESATLGDDEPWTTSGVTLRGTVRNGGFTDIGAALATGWAHMQFHWGTSPSVADKHVFALWNESNAEELFRVSFFNGAMYVQYHNGSGFATLVEPLPNIIQASQNAVWDFDVNWQLGNSDGYIRVYMRGQLVMSFEGDTIFRTSTDVDRVGWQSPFLSSTGATCSSFIISDECTIGCHVAELLPEADGVTMDWDGEDTNGGYLSVDNFGQDDTTFLSAGTNGLVALFAATDVNAAIANNWAIHGVGINYRAQSDGAAPQQIRAVLRSGGINYTGDTQALENGTFQGRHFEWQNDPDDTAPITETDANAFEIGFECVT